MEGEDGEAGVSKLERFLDTALVGMVRSTSADLFLEVALAGLDVRSTGRERFCEAAFLAGDSLVAGDPLAADGSRCGKAAF